MTLLRKHCPLLAQEALPGRSVSELLSGLRAATHRLRDLMAPGAGATNRDVLILLRDNELVTLDPRIVAYLDDMPRPSSSDGPERNDDEEEASREIVAMDAFLACPAEQLRGYRRYVQQQSPFSTQQGIKGAEFDRVLVVLDDDEGTHAQFSYDKYFRLKPPSARDLENLRSGKETVIERTRRLFYVCCTRALADLVVVYFSTEPALAEQRVREARIFADEAIFNEAALS
jgi:DNA helicase-2/ATP-dependent DNA helicase PcrA